ncbi:Gibberellin receptor GID1B [Hibiscus syriacus]|uniref:Gibberellin receptor GID1B n=1 Tax=Hibiscus syriacus TaxID=106335 RepID=A0A6A2YJZ3_HIBSY|nr:Gibberellin receptor GID1B [Hibiscus syriacus]
MARSNEINLNECKMVVPLNTWVLISNFKLAYNLLRRPDGTFNRHLAEFLDRKVPANANPVDGVFSFDVLIDRATSLLSRIYRPAAAEEPQLNVAELEKPVTAEVVPVIISFMVEAFLIPRLTAPSTTLYVGDCQKDSKVHIYLAGDSSGGNIVHHVALRAMESGIDVLGNILLNPMFGGQERTESEERLDGKYFVTLRDRDWYWRAYLPEGKDRDHHACNPFGPNGRSLEGIKLPKSLVVVAGLDLIQDWQLAYVEGLKKAGQEVKLLYMEHATIGFYLLPNNHHFHTVMDEISKFVEEVFQLVAGSGCVLACIQSPGFDEAVVPLEYFDYVLEDY